MDGYSIVLDQYAKSAHYLTEAVQKAKEACLLFRQ